MKPHGVACSRRPGARAFRGDRRSRDGGRQTLRRLSLRTGVLSRVESGPFGPQSERLRFVARRNSAGGPAPALAWTGEQIALALGAGEIREPACARHKRPARRASGARARRSGQPGPRRRAWHGRSPATRRWRSIRASLCGSGTPAAQTRCASISICSIFALLPKIPAPNSTCCRLLSAQAGGAARRR